MSFCLPQADSKHKLHHSSTSPTTQVCTLLSTHRRQYSSMLNGTRKKNKALNSCSANMNVRTRHWSEVAVYCNVYSKHGSLSTYLAFPQTIAYRHQEMTKQFNFSPGNNTCTSYPNCLEGKRLLAHFSISGRETSYLGLITAHLFRRPLRWTTIFPDRWSSMISNSPMYPTKRIRYNTFR